MIRQPIVSVLGHIDHGKTTLLDHIRGTLVAAKEAGGITQHIGATEIPIDVVKKICGDLLNTLKIKVTIPGLLFIDTPGHAAFTNLRKRGGSIADIGVLIVDVNEGFMPQTFEAFKILKIYKTPFMVVANKIDLVPGWKSQPDTPFLQTFKAQRPEVQQELDTKLYELVETLYRNEVSSERFDRVEDFTKQAAVVPISAKTGEGIPDFLMVLTGLTQKYLENSLKINVKGPGRGNILEVKQTTGLGTTLDVIIYDGTIKKGATIVLGTMEKPIHTNIKAILRPSPLQEIRISGKFKPVNEVHAATGIKIAAPGIDKALAGAPVYVVEDPAKLEQTKKEIQKEIESISIKTEKLGIVVKADTLGSLEALVKMLEQDGIPVRKAGFGDVSRKDLVEAQSVQEEKPLLATVFAFNVKTLPGVKTESADAGVKIFHGNIVYSLIDDYKKWAQEEEAKFKEATLETVILPAKLKLMQGYVFRQSNPAIAGFEILQGTVKPKYPLMTEDGIKIGDIKAVQQENESLEEATAGMQVALSIPGVTIGRNIKENDTLYVRVPSRDAQSLRTKLKDFLTEADLELLEEIERIKRKVKQV